MTNTRLGFRTRYHAQVIDATTQQPVGKPRTINNMVLNSGFIAMGGAKTFSALSIGASSVPAKETQTNLLRPVATVNITEDLFKSQVLAAEGSFVTSTLTFTTIFKDISFPQSSNTMSIYEVGVPGVTRAIFLEPLSVSYGQWISMTMEVIFVYGSSQGTFDIPSQNSYVGQTISYTVEPFIQNPKAANKTGLGYGADNALVGYLWDQTDLDTNNLPQSVTATGLVITPLLDVQNYQYQFNVAGLVGATTQVKGFVIVDNLNGGGFKIRLQGDGISLVEDDTLNLTFSFLWAKDIS